MPGGADELAAAFDLIVAATLVGLAAALLFVPGLYRAAVLFIVFGLVLTIAWVRLDAFDVALAEAAIGAGLLGALIVGAVRQLERNAQHDAQRGARQGAEPANPPEREAPG